MRFDIELLGFDGEAPIDGLAEAFDVDRQTAREIAARAPVFVKRDVDEKAAEGYFHALRELGGRVKLHKRATMPPPKAAPSTPPRSFEPIELDFEPHPRSAPPPKMVEASSIP